VVEVLVVQGFLSVHLGVPVEENEVQQGVLTWDSFCPLCLL
jgi:hypothetical protein